MKRNPLSNRARAAYITKMGVWAVLWGIPVGAVGCLLCIVPPLGIPVVFVAAWPLARMINTRTREVQAWRASPTPGMTLQNLDEALWEGELDDQPWNER